jgi:hypothetical protein
MCTCIFMAAYSSKALAACIWLFILWHICSEKEMRSRETTIVNIVISACCCVGSSQMCLSYTIHNRTQGNKNYLGTLSTFHSVWRRVIEFLMNNELERIWRSAVMPWVWVLPQNLLLWVKEMCESPRSISVASRPGLNLRSPKYEAELVTIPPHLVIFFQIRVCSLLCRSPELAALLRKLNDYK